MASDLEAGLRTAFERGDLPGLHGVHVAKDGDVWAELYFEGKDESWGRPLGLRQHGPDTLHDLRSVTKSVVGLLYGAALADGLAPPPEASLLDQFPQYPDLAEDPARARWTIEHALTMTLGTEWNEDLPYTDARNSEIAMELAEDRYRFVLDRPIVHEPGETWTYNGGATALIARIVADSVGEPLDVYAKRRLFDPLGIETFEWVRGADGEIVAASGLRLTLHDLAKIGELAAGRGVYRGERILPADWIEASIAPHAAIEGPGHDPGLAYGYFWWLDGSTPPLWFAGFGNGGQRLTVGARTGVVTAIFAGAYNDPDAWRTPVRVIVDHVVPATAPRR